MPRCNICGIPKVEGAIHEQHEYTDIHEGGGRNWGGLGTFMFNNLCNELDRWTKMQVKMQVDGKQEDRKESYHLELILERLFKYMFQEDFGVIKKKTTKIKKK